VERRPELDTSVCLGPRSTANGSLDKDVVDEGDGGLLVAAAGRRAAPRSRVQSSIAVNW
jgi:hypothetical protein